MIPIDWTEASEIAVKTHAPGVIFLVMRRMAKDKTVLWAKHVELPLVSAIKLQKHLEEAIFSAAGTTEHDVMHPA